MDRRFAAKIPAKRPTKERNPHAKRQKKAESDQGSSVAFSPKSVLSSDTAEAEAEAEAEEKKDASYRPSKKKKSKEKPPPPPPSADEDVMSELGSHSEASSSSSDDDDTSSVSSSSTSHEDVVSEGRVDESETSAVGEKRRRFDDMSQTMDEDDAGLN